LRSLQEIQQEASKKFSRILRRRPRPTLGCGAKERRRIKSQLKGITKYAYFYIP
jgi:hypothetical protein